LKTTAVRLPPGHNQFAGFVMPRRAPRCFRACHNRPRQRGQRRSRATRAAPTSTLPKRSKLLVQAPASAKPSPHGRRIVGGRDRSQDISVDDQRPREPRRDAKLTVRPLEIAACELAEAGSHACSTAHYVRAPHVSGGALRRAGLGKPRDGDRMPEDQPTIDPGIKTLWLSPSK
jgi:hypothetical protein